MAAEPPHPGVIPALGMVLISSALSVQVPRESCREKEGIQSLTEQNDAEITEGIRRVAFVQYP